MELSNEQRELLSAYLDGEVNASERALAQALLERSEAAAYFTGLKRMRDLAREHGAARAPRNFAALVRQSLEGDFDGISRPTSNSGDYDGISRPTSNQAPVHSLPTATWRTPLLAAAAAIVMALGIFAYNALVLPAATPAEVAKSHQPKDPETALDGSPDLAGRVEKNVDDHNEEAPPANDPEALKKTEDLRRWHDDVERANRKKAPEDAADSLEEKKGDRYEAEKVGTDAKTKDAGKNSTPEKSDKGATESDGSGIGTGGGAGGSDPSSRKEAEGKRARTGSERGQGEAKPGEAGPAPKPPAPEASRPAEDQPAKEMGKAKELREEVTIDVSGTRAADSPSLTTDLLQVASVYGEATASNDEKGTTIEVEVNEDQLEEMVAALNKMAKEAGSDESRARREANKPEADEQSKKEPARARDYLPKDPKGEPAKESPESGAKADGEESEKPNTASPAQPAKAKKKVRIIVRLK